MNRGDDIAGSIRNGDIGAFESLFRSSYSPLVRYASTIVRDKDTAEEIVQDLFYRLWADRKKTEIKSSLNGYLFRSVYNRCMHLIEHRKVVRKYESEMALIDAGSPPTPLQEMQYGELQDKIARTLENLPERCCEIFCLNRFEGLKYSEIASKLSISVKTVEANMGRALKEFRKAVTGL
ncbi:MAG: RNA polymerase sigma-70 factor [Bacteroidetes bacterium]|nr:RNA polymerase sigma-70 factor [Bacteroidota bacterium]